MLKTLWFLIKLGLFLAFILWLFDQPGSIELEWSGVTASTHIGFFVAAALIIGGIILFLYDGVKSLLSIPKNLSTKKKIKNIEKGNDLLTAIFSALSARDTEMAKRKIKKAKKLLGEDHSILLLTQAINAKLSDKHNEAQVLYQRLLNTNETAFLGLNGLLQLKNKQGDIRSALDYARKAEQFYPKQAWIVKTLYDLETRSQNWTHSLSILNKLNHMRGIDQNRYYRDKAALLFLKAEEATDKDKENYLKKAVQADAEFIPAIDAYLTILIEKKKKRAAQNLFEKTWKQTPHVTLLKHWQNLMPKKYQSSPIKETGWYDKLAYLNLESHEGQIAAAKKALELNLFAKTRDYLRKAESIYATAGVYKLFARLEEMEHSNSATASAWLEKASNAKPDLKWLCSETGITFENWQAFSTHETSFNSLVLGNKDDNKTATLYKREESVPEDIALIA